MTTLPQYQGIDEIRHRLDMVRSRRRLVAGTRNVLALACVALVTLLVVSASAGYWPDQPPQALRWGLAALAGAAVLFPICLFLVRSLLSRTNHAQLARSVELALPELKNDLINSILLSGDDQQPSQELVQQAILEAHRRSQSVDLLKSVSMLSLRRWALAAGLAAIMLGGFGVFQGGAFRRGLLAVFSPRSYVGWTNDIQLVSLEPGDATRFAGESLTIVARIANDASKPLAGEVILDQDQSDAGASSARAKAPNERTASRPMIATDGYSTFSLPLGIADQTLRYAVRIGNSRWPQDRPWYTLTVIRHVKVQSLAMQYSFPPYTGLAPKDVPNSDGNVEAPLGTNVSLKLTLEQDVRAGSIQMADGSAEPMASGDGKVFAGRFGILKDGGYRIVLKDSSGRTVGQLPDTSEDAGASAAASGYFRIHPIPDNPPKIDFVSPNRDVTVSPGGKLTVKLSAKDDYGLGEVAIFCSRQGQEPRRVKTFDHLAAVPSTRAAGVRTDARPWSGEYTFDLAGMAENDVLNYYATATDNRNIPSVGGPQTSQTRHFKLVIQDAAKLEAQKAKLYEELRNRLLALLKMQEPQRVNTEICSRKHTSADQIAATGKEIAAAQMKIRADLLDLVEKFPFDADMITVQQACALLASNEAALAVEQSKALATLADFAAREKFCSPLAHSQNTIISTLQTLLAILPSLSKPDGPADKSAAGANLPPEAREKLAELKADLEKFIEGQKKIVQASQNLAKKPVDNLTPEDQQILKDLQAAQDKWEKFINEKFADLSKMAQQDFANPVLLKELISVKSDVTMAKDALSQKAAEIATALEDNGIENAKTLTANIEKWLPDTPDRQKWSMEDPKGQENVQQPELPKELEDLVGDLLEQEEDLFQDMEDVTSKYNQSGDKGIGWDATDGPISNMNAQGVTGNQLPNKDELSGRSGEGRQGKSSGEFVEDKAVGKGGRRTPTRLTAEPFQKGQIDDKSAEAAGGATGGGKMSGAGQEGLEGPVPPPLAKELKRLAGQQATLLNKAQRLQEKFQVSNFANFKFLQAITLMNRVQGDLQDYHYQNALRAKDTTIGAIGQTKLLLSGKIDVAADSSSSMPKYVRDEIADVTDNNLPAEYREALKQYYRRLSQRGQTPTTAPSGS